MKFYVIYGKKGVLNMSRIGKLPIHIPKDVNIYHNGNNFEVNGKFGNLQITIPEIINIIENNNIITVSLKKNIKSIRSLHGLYRTLINNMVIGVSEQFELTLILKGVGYRAAIQGKEVILNLGYSHPVILEIPETISVEILQNTTINLKSCDKQLLGLFASNIRSWRRPEPYKGKGILYKNEQILRKVGKSGK